MKLVNLEDIIKELEKENLSLKQENEILLSELEDARRILNKEGLL